MPPKMWALVLVLLTSTFATGAPKPMPAASAICPGVSPAGSHVVENCTFAGYGITGLAAGGEPTQRGGPPPYVRGAWTVPAVGCIPLENSGSSVWIGLGGINAPLAQIATTSGCSVGTPQYSAYIQMAGHPGFGAARPLTSPNGTTLTVAAGDKMIAAVRYDGAGRYALHMRDDTQGWDYDAQQRGSAETGAWDTALWIVEAPTVGNDNIQVVQLLANFGSASFSGCFTNVGPIDDSRHASMSRFKISRLTAQNFHKATASELTDGPVAGSTAVGSDFTVNWQFA